MRSLINNTSNQNIEWFTIIKCKKTKLREKRLDKRWKRNKQTEKGIERMNKENKKIETKWKGGVRA